MSSFDPVHDSIISNESNDSNDTKNTEDKPLDSNEITTNNTTTVPTTTTTTNTDTDTSIDTLNSNSNKTTSKKQPITSPNQSFSISKIKLDNDNTTTTTTTATTAEQSNEDTQDTDTTHNRVTDDHSPHNQPKDSKSLMSSFSIKKPILPDLPSDQPKFSIRDITRKTIPNLKPKENSENDIMKSVRNYQTLLINSRNRHLKKEDGEPYWRKDIKYEFIKTLFFNNTRCFKNPFLNEKKDKSSETSETSEIPSFDFPRHFKYYKKYKEDSKSDEFEVVESNGDYLTFFELYAITLLKSDKISKILKDRLMIDMNYSFNFAVLCILVNVGRLNTTVNFDYEMKSQLRTYHSIPSLEVDDHTDIIIKNYDLNDELKNFITSDIVNLSLNDSNADAKNNTVADNANKKQEETAENSTDNKDTTTVKPTDDSTTTNNRHIVKGQQHNIRGGSGYTMATVKPLQDTPRLKSILKSVNDLYKDQPKLLPEFLKGIKDGIFSQNIISLVFLLCIFEFDLGTLFYPGLEDEVNEGDVKSEDENGNPLSSGSLFNDIWLRDDIYPESQVERFLWLIYFHCETKLDPVKIMNNPFNTKDESVLSSFKNNIVENELYNNSDKIYDNLIKTDSKLLDSIRSLKPIYKSSRNYDVYDIDTKDEKNYSALMKSKRLSFLNYDPENSEPSSLNQNTKNNNDDEVKGKKFKSNDKSSNSSLATAASTNNLKGSKRGKLKLKSNSNGSKQKLKNDDYNKKKLLSKNSLRNKSGLSELVASSSPSNKRQRVIMEADDDDMLESIEGHAGAEFDSSLDYGLDPSSGDYRRSSRRRKVPATYNDQENSNIEFDDENRQRGHYHHDVYDDSSNALHSGGNGNSHDASIMILDEDDNTLEDDELMLLEEAAASAGIHTGNNNNGHSGISHKNNGSAGNHKLRRLSSFSSAPSSSSSSAGHPTLIKSIKSTLPSNLNKINKKPQPSFSTGFNQFYFIPGSSTDPSNDASDANAKSEDSNSADPSLSTVSEGDSSSNHTDFSISPQSFQFGTGAVPYIPLYSPSSIEKLLNYEAPPKGSRGGPRSISKHTIARKAREHARNKLLSLFIGEYCEYKTKLYQFNRLKTGNLKYFFGNNPELILDSIINKNQVNDNTPNDSILNPLIYNNLKYIDNLILLKKDEKLDYKNYFEPTKLIDLELSKFKLNQYKLEKEKLLKMESEKVEKKSQDSIDVVKTEDADEIMKDADPKNEETEKKDETDDTSAAAMAAAAVNAATAATDAIAAIAATATTAATEYLDSVKPEVDTVPSAETPIPEGTPADSVTAEATPAPETPIGEASNTVEDSKIVTTAAGTTTTAPVTANATPVPETTKKSKVEKKDTIDLEDFGESKKSMFNMYKRVNDIIFSTLIRQQGFIKNPRKVNTEIEDFRPSSSEFIDNLFASI
ncbi:hypothetical protein B5S33_g3045 [[Candida] boidinii]|nr:hypothetical protein B5S33_g3045 [[Candida] boidinii]